ncbi:SCY1-like protein 2 isoform X2 [Saccostrea echinata]|uniref:SCY1-like protein 2 isoform X2 n=1 Tax=Saccostrea echinata TaxID=191078 RepID=UPI002A80AFC4|nr:SCY1-like protein 2 isoform X2 [Saccostrea echinata]
MEMFSLIKSSLASEDANPIHRLYRVGQQVGTGGQEMLWRIHEAESIEEEKGASVFIFNKKIANKLHKPRRREQVSEILRHDVTLLNKMSNASVLTIYHGLQEDKDSLSFASEPVAGSLANFLERFDKTSPQSINTTCGFMEHEVQCGIYQITEALMYVHGVERMIHRNVNPASILITQSGRWKLACFGFAEKTQDGRESFSCKAWSPKISKMAQPDLNYIAPEIQTTEVCTYVSDMFSFGMLICTIYNNGHSLIDAQYNPTVYVKQLDTLTQKFGDIAPMMPPALVDPVEKMINRDIRYRPTAQLFSLLKMFHDPTVSTLQQLDNLHLKSPSDKSHVFSVISQNIPLLPKAIRCSRLLPSLHQEFTSRDSVVTALPPLLSLVQHSSSEEFSQYVFPEITFVFNCSKPEQATVYLLNKIDFIISKCTTNQVRSDVMPFILKHIKSESFRIQEAALNALLVVKECLDDAILKSTVLPCAKEQFLQTADVKIKLIILSCIKHLLSIMNPFTVREEVLPFLVDIANYQDASVILAVVGIYKHMLNKRDSVLTRIFLAQSGMPSLLPHTVDPELSTDQFSIMMDVLYDMLGLIEQHRRSNGTQSSTPQRERLAPSGGSDKNLLFVGNSSPSGIQKSRTECSISSLTRGRLSRNSSQEAPNSPELSKLKEKEMLTVSSKEPLRRFSLVPPGGGTPAINLTPDDGGYIDRNRRPSLQNMGQYNHDSERYERKSSTGSLFSFSEPRHTAPRRGSFQALGDTVMQLFSSK